MSELFTKVEDWPAAGQDMAAFNEICLAASERSLALKEGIYPLKTAGMTAQGYLQDVLYLQGWLESKCVRYVDNVSGPLAEDGKSILFFTLASWRAAAGLNAAGFTRKTGEMEALTTSYGLVQAGDVRGPWMFEELQKGLSALKWTYFSSKENFEATSVKSGAAEGEDCEAQKAACNAAFAAMPWTTTTGVYYGVYATAAWADWPDPTPDYYWWKQARARGKAGISGVPEMPHVAELYFCPKQTGGVA